jgi:DNA invertase Pin-like site-specific DNA recombinase
VNTPAPVIIYQETTTPNVPKALPQRGKLTKAVAYLRTSSAANVGAEKDSDKRQLAAISRFARSAGFELVGTYYDAAVSGADPVDSRAGFAEMLELIASNGVRTIIVETASRFARDLMVQETGFARLQAAGITLIAADSPASFQDDTPTAILVRQVLGAIAQFDKAMTVAKLAGARKRKRATGVKVEGRRSYAEQNANMVALAKTLRRRSPKGGQRSLRAISAELARAGFLTGAGKPYAPAAVAKMVAVRC